MPSPDSKIIIVGAGVFGLSTSLWLARAGYKDITIFDRTPYDKNYYNPSDGCDGASADINKIFRMTYGARDRYVDHNQGLFLLYLTISLLMFRSYLTMTFIKLSSPRVGGKGHLATVEQLHQG